MAASTQQRIVSDENVFTNTLANSQRITTGTHYVKGTGSLGRLKYHQKHRSLDYSDEELEYAQLSQSTHILGRVKSERMLAFNSDGHRRRRTIIVEKRNNSFGFTLQSYAIHYRRDPEFETITYVDYVEYDGPAYRAGMREGDVILSINGVDLEKSDHKTLVAFIKSCDTRMRMVVLFEDCVRKVELHMRYIQLQTLLQNKLHELEYIALRERELLDIKWKTHSLPVRKKANTSPTDIDISPLNGTDYSFYRPTLSTEDVSNTTRYYTPTTTIIPPPAQFRLTRHYRTPTCISKVNNLIHNPRELSNTNDQQHHVFLPSGSEDEKTLGLAEITQKNSEEKQEQQRQPQQKQQKQESSHHIAEAEINKRTRSRVKSNNKHCHSHSCNPCIGHFRWKSAQKAAATLAAAANANFNINSDNISLDAYDLASPCCDTHCVPPRRRLHQKQLKQRENDYEQGQERTIRQKSKPNVERHQQQQSQLPSKQQQQTSQQRHQGHHHHPQYQLQLQEQNSPDSKKHQKQQNQQHQQLHAYPSTGSESLNGRTSLRSHYIDLASGLISYCNLHQSRNSGDQVSGNDENSQETLYWEQINTPQQQEEKKGFRRKQPSKSSSSFQLTQDEFQKQQQWQNQQPQKHLKCQYQQKTCPRPPPRPAPQALYGGMYQQRFHITATQIQPSQICINPFSNVTAFVQKPRSWDNLTTKAIATGYGYGYLDTTTALKTTPITAGVQATKKFQIQQQRHSMPRKNPHGRFSAYAATNVENYAPPPSQFVGEYTTTTTTTTILAKSTEHLISPTPTPNQNQSSTTSASITQQHPQAQTQIQHKSQKQQIGVEKICGCSQTHVINLKEKAQLSAFKTAQMEINQSKKFSHYNKCKLGYYSHLPRPTTDVGTSTKSVSVSTNDLNVREGTDDVTTVSEVTRL